MKVLSVAEKPSVAKEIAKIIGENPQPHRRTGHSPYNQIFEIPQCKFRGQNCSMSVTSVTGHLMEIEFDARYKSWGSCQPVDLFGAPIHKIVKKENEPIKKNLHDEARKSNVLLLWLDCDLEGENIAFEVISVCREANPRLDIYRARFSALIPRDIMRTLAHPERPNEHFNDAVDARQEIDLRLGAAFTRFQTLRLQSKFENVINTVVSYGPCQFPTLGFIVDRHLEIEAFRPQSFWNLSCDYDHTDPVTNQKLNVSFTWNRGNVYDHFACVILFDSCVSAAGGIDNCQAEVCKCDARPTHRYRPAPLNTVELQKRASNFLHMSSDRTMHVAEALYQRGILSYPRTETDFFKEGFELHAIIREHTGHSQWGAFTSDLMTSNKFLWPKNGGHDDQAHPPIHPTKCVELAELESNEERNLYDLVCRHFFACCARDGVGDQTNITICIPPRSTAQNDNTDDSCYIHSEYFSATGLMIRERNWLEVYSKYESWYGHQVPSFIVGDIFKLKSFNINSGQTHPPPPLSESDLISEMDKNGIGTDATIATHISTVQQREYAVKDQNNRFVPTKLGLALIEAYNEMGYQLNKPYLRATMEKDCQKIARGEMRKEEMIRNCLTQMRECFVTCSKEAEKLDKSVRKYFPPGVGGAGADNANYQVIQAAFSTCGKCTRQMILRVRVDATGNNNNSRQLFCDTCMTSLSLPSKNELEPHDMTCPLCSYQVLTVRNADTNKEHTLCPFCFKNPPPPPYSDDQTGEFRCFSCANSACSLSGKIPGENVQVIRCASRACRDHMKIRKTSKGYILVCMNQTCGSKWWFPKYVKTAIPQENMVCNNCSRSCGSAVHKVLMSINISLAPPGTPLEITACPVCDELWSMNHVQTVQLPAFSASSLPLESAQPRAPIIQHVDRIETVETRGPIVQHFANYNNFGAASDSGGDYGAAATGKGVQEKKRATAAGGRGGRGGKTAAGKESSLAKGDPASDRQCHCGQPASVGVTVKEGPNKGRPFASCAVKRSGQEGCRYFEWLDESASNGPPKMSLPPGASIAAPGRVICSRCNQLGHYARSCPNK